MSSTEYKQYFTVHQPLGVECLEPIKIDLDQRGLLDAVLKSNFEFAMKALEAMSITKRKDASLQVGGEKTLMITRMINPLMKPRPRHHHHSINHTVWNDNGSLKLLQKIQINDKKLTKADIDASHFLGHCCRDEVESCMKQAHKVVASKEGGLDNVELKIMCGELQLAYITQDPSTTIQIQPEWRVKIKHPFLDCYLRVKHCMEKVGEMSPGMLACFRLLLTNPKLEKKSYCLSLMSEGQKVEFIYNNYEEDFVIISDEDQAKTVCSRHFY